MPKVPDDHSQDDKVLRPKFGMDETNTNEVESVSEPKPEERQGESFGIEESPEAELNLDEPVSADDSADSNTSESVAEVFDDLGDGPVNELDDLDEVESTDDVGSAEEADSPKADDATEDDKPTRVADTDKTDDVAEPADTDEAATTLIPTKPKKPRPPRKTPSFLRWLTRWRKGDETPEESTGPSLHQPHRYSTALLTELEDTQIPPVRRPMKATPVSLNKMRRKLYILSFVVPFLLLFLAYSTVGFYPIGDKTPLTIDMYHQYAPFLSELKRKLAGGESLFYAWNSGLGVNFYSLIAYYAASPFNLLLLLFPLEHLTEGIYLMTLLKTGLMGLTMSIFLEQGLSSRGLLSLHRPNVNVSYRRPAVPRLDDEKPRYARQDTATDLAILALSTAYALSSYTFSYAWNVMWLDGLVLLPLVMLGLLKLLREKKIALYSLTLGLSIIVNYYIAVFVCLFAVFYFVYQIFIDPKTQRTLSRGKLVPNYLKRGLLFAFASLLGAGISAIMSLPTFLSILHTSASGDAWPTVHDFFFEIFDFPARHFLGTVPNVRSGLPNVYSGLLTVLFIPIYLKAERISLREKAFSVTALVLLFFAFNSNFLNFFWHGMHYPNQLPHRFAFVYVFFIITLAYRGITNTNFEGSALTVLKTVAGLAFYLMLVQKLGVEEISELMIYVNLFFLGLYVILFLLARVHSHRLRYVASLLLVVFLAELAMNGISMANQMDDNEYYTRRSDFIRDFSEVEELIAEARNRESDDAFYRMELEPQKTTNDPALYGYPGFTLFSSTSPEQTAALMRSLGYHGNNINSYKYVDSTPFLDALWGLKYFVWKNGESNDPRHVFLREVAAEDRTARLYENPDALGLGIAAHPSLAEWTGEAASAFENQRTLALSLTGIDGLYAPLELSEVTVANAASQGGSAAEGYRYKSNDVNTAGSYKLSYTADAAKRAFFFVDTSRSSTIRYQVKNGEEVVREVSRSINKPEIFDPGPLAQGEILEINVEYAANEGSDWTIWLAEQPMDTYEAIMTALKNRSIEWTYESDTSLTAKVTDQANAILFLSIPYDAGWNLYINDELAPVDSLVKVGGGLLGYRLPGGVLDLRLEFKPEGFTLGLFVTLGSLLVWAMIVFLQHRQGGVGPNERQTIISDPNEHAPSFSKPTLHVPEPVSIRRE